MKKYITYLIILLILTGGILFLLNPRGIYQLNDKTAKFIPHQEIPSGLVSLKAKDCGICHIEIFKEWQQSLHSQAYTDPFFTAYHKKDKGDPTCLVCHTPVENQNPFILTSTSGQYNDLFTTPNPEFDAEFQQEGVTCAACHVKDGIIYGPFHENTMDAPHPVAYDKEFTSKSLCEQCHEVPSKSFSLMKGSAAQVWNLVVASGQPEAIYVRIVICRQWPDLLCLVTLSEKEKSIYGPGLIQTVNYNRCSVLKQKNSRIKLI